MQLLCACYVLSDKYGRGSDWTEELFFGGTVAEEVDRLAKAGGKSVLYKPSGSVLESTFKTHEHPSIDEMKDKWTKACVDPQISQHMATTERASILLSEIKPGFESDEIRYDLVVEAFETDAHLIRQALFGIVLCGFCIRHTKVP